MIDVKRCLNRSLLVALMGLGLGCGRVKEVYQGPTPKHSPLINWPKASEDRPVEHPVWIRGEVDMHMTRFFGVDELATASQAEGQEPLIKMADGAVLKNAILGYPAADGIHCKGSCTLINVWWERVGEDAATFRGQTDDDTMNVIGGGASGARDKVFQNNGRGTMHIKDFYVEWFGKLYRSCGNCSVQTSRGVIVENVTAIAGDDSEALVGINVNFGDYADFRGQNVVYDPTGKLSMCQVYEGNSKGDEPRKIGAGKNSAFCRNVDDVNVRQGWDG